MSRSREDWLREKGKVMAARLHVRRAFDFIDEYEPWHTDSEESALSKVVDTLVEAEKALNELIGVNTVDWVENE